MTNDDRTAGERNALKSKQPPAGTHRAAGGHQRQACAVTPCSAVAATNVQHVRGLVSASSVSATNPSRSEGSTGVACGRRPVAR